MITIWQLFLAGLIGSTPILLVLALIDFIICMILLKKGYGRKILKKVPLYSSLITLLFPLIIIIYLIINPPVGEEGMGTIIIPIYILLCITIVPLVGYVVAFITYKSYKNKNG